MPVIEQTAKEQPINLAEHQFIQILFISVQAVFCAMFTSQIHISMTINRTTLIYTGISVRTGRD